MKKYIIIFIFFVSFTSCEKIMCREDDDELFFTRKEYIGNEARTDGYYHRIGYNGVINDVYFLFRNGVIMSLSGAEDNIKEMDKYILDRINNREYDWPKFTYGVFLISDNKITVERWQPSKCPYKTAVMAGNIINDTTFVINEIYRMQDGAKTDIRELDRTYHFRQFSPKPDSTNNYIE